MERVEELTLKLADGDLGQAEADELIAILQIDPAAVQFHLAALDLEAALRGTRRLPDLSEATLARLREHLGERVTGGVMEAIRTGPRPEWTPGAGAARSAGTQARPTAPLVPLRRSARRLPSQWRLPALVAAGLAVAAGVWWYAGRRSAAGDQPIARLTSAPSGWRLERDGKTNDNPGQDAGLFAGDRLSLPYGPARVEYADKTYLMLERHAVVEFVGRRSDGSDGASARKHVHAVSGRLTAYVRPQPAGSPMIFTTVHARVQVVGTVLTILSGSDKTTVSVDEGAVRVTRLADAAAIEVVAGHTAVASPNADLVAVPIRLAERTETLAASADTYVDQHSPTHGFGGAGQWRIGRHASREEVVAFLRFNVDVKGPVRKAVLRLTAAENGEGGSVFVAASNDWDEQRMNFHHAPPVRGAAVAAFGASHKGRELEIDVTSAVTGSGPITFVLKSDRPHGGLFHSRETQHGPRLEVTIQETRP